VITTGWDAYLPFREDFAALAPDKYPAEYIDCQVAAHFWQCWGDGQAAILAEVKQYPSGLREVHGIAAAGALESIKELIPLAEAYGRHVGCTVASIESREGWAKLLPGYEVEQIRIVKGL